MKLIKTIWEKDKLRIMFCSGYVLGIVTCFTILLLINNGVLK